MKKALTTILIIASLICNLNVFAGPYTGLEPYENLFDYSKPVSVMNSQDINYFVFSNPSALSEAKTSINLPTISLNANHIALFLKTNSELLAHINTMESLSEIFDIGTGTLINSNFAVVELLNIVLVLISAKKHSYLL